MQRAPASETRRDLRNSQSAGSARASAGSAGGLLGSEDRRTNGVSDAGSPSIRNSTPSPTFGVRWTGADELRRLRGGSAGLRRSENHTSLGRREAQHPKYGAISETRSPLDRRGRAPGGSAASKYAPNIGERDGSRTQRRPAPKVGAISEIRIRPREPPHDGCPGPALTRGRGTCRSRQPQTSDSRQAAWSFAKRPSPPIRFSGESSSMIRPCSMTRTRSAIATVDRRWAMMIAVRSASRVCRAS